MTNITEHTDKRHSLPGERQSTPHMKHLRAQPTSRQHLIFSFQHSSCYATTAPLQKAEALLSGAAAAMAALTDHCSYSQHQSRWQHSLTLTLQHHQTTSRTTILLYDSKSEQSTFTTPRNDRQCSAPLLPPWHLLNDTTLTCAIHRY